MLAGFVHILFSISREHLFTLAPLAPTLGTAAPGLTIAEAFRRLMAVAERDYMIFRTCWVMNPVSPQKPPEEPEFASSLAVDAQARAAIILQVCEHGLGFLAWFLTNNSNKSKSAARPARSKISALRPVEAHASASPFIARETVLRS
jgi:hypothetical protein